MTTGYLGTPIDGGDSDSLGPEGGTPPPVRESPTDLIRTDAIAVGAENPLGMRQIRIATFRDGTSMLVMEELGFSCNFHFSADDLAKLRTLIAEVTP